MRINPGKITVLDTASVLETIKVVNEGAMGVALVVDVEGKLVGLVTDGDIRRALLSGSGLEDKIRTVMNINPVFAEEGASLKKIQSMMSEKIRHIPILDKNGRVIDLAYYVVRQEIPVAKPFLNGNELKYVTECVLSGWISSRGKYIPEFEDSFAGLCGAKYGIAVSNGTVALHLALVALGIGPEDEVIVPTLSFIATANAVTYTGAKPVFVDSELDTWNIDPEKIEEKITPRTKAIIPVHLYGHPVNMEPIMEIAKKHDLYIIEDAAEAHGAEYRGQKVGSIGILGCFSFFGNKIITTGEGGMLTTNDNKLAEKIKIFRDHGMSREKKYWYPVIGFNYRLTNVQAAIGVAQMEKIEDIIEKKIQIAEVYNSCLRGTEGIILPPKLSWAKNVYWTYSILTEDSFPICRDTLADRLRENGIDTRPLFYPIHRMPPYLQNEEFPVADNLSKRGLSLPSSIDLTDEDIGRVSEVVKACREKFVSKTVT